MNIGQAARATGLSAKMVRYYEAAGLLGRVRRSVSGYRKYGEADLHTLRFVRRARDLGFTVAQIGELVSLWRNTHRSSATVKTLASRHLVTLAAKIAELEAMSRTLAHLAENCHGDDRPDCPILDDLAQPNPNARPTAK
ncbi:MAG: Cu(I)-responsive transcriptional regulator [Gammaproteobacteria bacterium]|nr:Cu(I)-responsive transcriptional regulator [Gammaproteobacteria bacterium]